MFNIIISAAFNIGRPCLIKFDLMYKLELTEHIPRAPDYHNVEMLVNNWKSLISYYNRKSNH